MSHYHQSERGTPLASLGYSASERTALTVARYFFHSFCEPSRQGWLGAFGHAMAVRGAEDGPRLALTTLATIQSIRRSRQSAFRFNAPTCRDCSAWITGNERSFMSALRAAIRNDRDSLDAHLWLLCEGNDPVEVPETFMALADLVAEAEPVAG